MDKYYVVDVGGHQEVVQDGDIIDVEGVKAEENGDFEIDKVLLVVDQGKVRVGKPYLKEKVSATLLKNHLGPKIRVAKFKAKTGYRRVTGYRASLSQVKINKLI